MCLKSSTFLFKVLFLFPVFVWVSVGSLNATQLQDSTSYIVDIPKVYKLIDQDSLVKAIDLLNTYETLSIKEGDLNELASTYNVLGNVFKKIGSYDYAIVYYKKALDIYKSNNNEAGINKALANTCNAYVKNKDFENFDIYYIKSDSVSKKLNSPVRFYDYENLILKYYFLDMAEELYTTTEAAIKDINIASVEDFENKEYTRSQDFYKRHQYIFRYYNAIALIKLRNPKGYKRLFDINENAFKKVLEGDSYSLRKVGTLNYYKYIYFKKVEKNNDSAFKYILESDRLKYEALNEFEVRNSTNGELLRKVLQAQKDQAQALELSIKDKKIAKTYLVATSIAVVLIITLIGFLLHYVLSRTKMKRMNTKLTASNKKLIQVDKERLEFFSVISHELRTPIFGINGLTNLILTEDNTTKLKSYLNSLKVSSEYIFLLINNVLQFSKFKFENKSLDYEALSIDKLIKDVYDTVLVSAKHKNLNLVLNIDKNQQQELLLTDRVALTQILVNITYNAIKYSNEGDITFNVKEQERTGTHVSLLFEIIDQGIGIKENERLKIFDAYKQSSSTLKNKGSGLGLYIVKLLLDKFQSEIQLDSIVNEGSNFYFTINFEIAKEIAASQETVKEEPLLSNKRILIVDDNKLNLLISKKNIENIGAFECVTALSGNEAINLLKKSTFDLILMDINMPDMDGYETTIEIRKFDKDIPVIALTALNFNDVNLKARASGMQHIITKPYSLNNFKEVIFEHLYKSTTSALV